MLCSILLRHHFVSHILIVAMIALASCGRDHTDRPRSAKDAANVINALNATDSESLGLANVYLTRFLPGLASASQDSVWMTYTDFVNRFIAAQQGRISRELLVDGNGPYATDGVITRTNGETWWLEPDPQWQYERYATRSDSSLHEWLRIRSATVEPGIAGSFRTIHRLEYWADHFPASPLLTFMQQHYREAITTVLSTLNTDYNPWRSDYVAMFDQLHLHAGLDAVKVVTKYISSQQNGNVDLNANAFTDTLRYRPRTWIKPTE